MKTELEKKYELLDCPFCGDKAELTDLGIGTGSYIIACKKRCGVLMTGMAKSSTIDNKKIHEEIRVSVIKKWNTRTYTPTSQQELPVSAEKFLASEIAALKEQEKNKSFDEQNNLDSYYNDRYERGQQQEDDDEFGPVDLTDVEPDKFYKQQEVPVGIKRYDLIQSGYPLPDHGKMIERKNGRYCEFDAIQRSKVTDEMIEKYAKSFPGNTGNVVIDAGVTAGFIEGAKSMRDNKITNDILS